MIIRVHRSCPSGRKIARALGWEFSSTHGDINWGCRARRRNGINFNAPDSKAMARMAMQERGVQVPRSGFHFPIHKPYQVVLRPFRHRGGSCLILCEGTVDEAEGFYWQEFIEKSQEFRVHVAHGKILCVSEKPQQVEVAWNLHPAEVFSTVDRRDWNLGVCLESVKAVEALGLHFGAVDVCLDRDGEAYVLEVNMAPGIEGDYLLGKYCKYFQWLENNRDMWGFRWPYESYTKGKSYAWLNCHFNKIGQ